jgi:tRNA dimethylallyltransferase
VTDGRVIHALCVCGPTSSGKSDASLAAAEDVGGEIVNADSRQIYAQMRIGTGWPSTDSLARVPHHLYGIISPSERYSAMRFVADAREAIAAIASRGRLPIIVGGTGLYIEALAGSMPMDRPAASDDVRLRVLREAQTHEHATLRDWLRTLDPAAATRVPPGDRYRTLRAIEGALALRESSVGAAIHSSPPPLPVLGLNIIVLRVPRTELRRRIGERVVSMFATGLENEAVLVRARWPAAPALSGIGYAEALALHDGTATRAEALARVSLRTSQYAARQETWFRRLRSALSIDAGDKASAIAGVVRAARETERVT